MSKLPIHNLAKQGSISIRIAKTTSDGAVDLYWEVSPSRNYGEPRQLAYKLDTIVINRKLDDLPRPLAPVVRLGGLRDLARSLGSTMAGTNRVKNALRQNAGALITAKFCYKGTDGAERTIDASFTRYGVVFTGEKLPTGARADAVYLILNQPYLDVLNNAPVRPLDYDYLKILTPVAQRFYEIASFRVFAALNYGHSEARLAYSEYCTYSAHERYLDYDHFKKQMYKVQRPHVQSGYIQAVRYERTRDADGNPDWNMFYEPGPKARAEFRAFSRKGAAIHRAAEGDAESSRSSTVETATSDSRPSRGPDAPPTSDSLRTLQRFHELARGAIGYVPAQGSREIRQAEDLLNQFGREQVDYIVSFAVRSARKTNFKMRTFGAILQYVPEAVAEFERVKIEDGEKRRLRLNREARERSHRKSLEAAKARLQSLPPGRYQALYEAVKSELMVEYPDVMKWKGPSIFEDTIQLKMAERLDARGENAA